MKNDQENGRVKIGIFAVVCLCCLFSTSVIEADTDNSHDISAAVSVLLNVSNSDLVPALPENIEGKFLIKIEADEEYSFEGGTSYEYSQQNSNLSMTIEPDSRVKLTVNGWGKVQGSPTKGRIWNLYFDRSKLSNSLFYQKDDNSSCNLATSAMIHEIVIENDRLIKLLADFENRCVDVDGVLRGSVFFNALQDDAEYVRPSIPPEGTYPELPELNSEGAVVRLITVTNPAGEIIEDNIYTPENSSFTIKPLPCFKCGFYPGLGFTLALDSGFSLDIVFRRGTLNIFPYSNEVVEQEFYSPVLPHLDSLQPAHQLETNIFEGCEGLLGEFLVRNIEYDGPNDIRTASAGFSISCAASPGTKVFGSFLYDNSLPPNQ